MIKRVLFCLILGVSAGVLVGCMFSESNDQPISSTLKEISISPTVSRVVAEPTIANLTTTVMAPVVLTDTPALPSVGTVTSAPSPTVRSISYPVTCSDWQEPVPLQPEEGLAGALGLVLPLTTVPNTESDNWAVIGSAPLQKRTLLPVHDLVGIGFSPDGEWFAYQMFPDSNSPGEQPLPLVYLMSFDGQTIATPIPLQAEESNGNWYAQWITDELMTLQYFPASQSTEIWLLGSYTLFNPFTGERYDDYLKGLPYWSENVAVYIAPDMTRAVYVSDAESEIGTAVVLWDMEQREILWISDEKPLAGFDEQYIGSRGFNQTAFWSPDSSGFVVTTWNITSNNQIQYNSYFVDRDGAINRTLVSVDDREGDIIQGGLWSPDGRFIYYVNNWSGRTFLYDLALDQTTELCMQANLGMVWSPDSRSLAFGENINGHLQLLVLDIFTGEMMDIGTAQSFIAFGWLANENWLSGTSHK